MRIIVVLLVLVAALLLICVPLAGAENLGPGGGTRVITGDEVVGPYRLLITSAPEPAQVGTVSFVVRVSDPSSGAKITDAEITVELRNGETGATAQADLTHADAGDPVDYAAHIAIDQPGSWEGVIRVRGPAGIAEVTFVQRVLPPRQIGTLLAMGLPFVVALAVLGGLWLARSGRQRNKAP